MMNNKGFSLVELMIVVAIIGILAAIAIPSYSIYIRHTLLRSAGEGIVSDLNFAHSESMRRDTSVYTAFSPVTDWCYGSSTSSACDCTVAKGVTDACEINSMLYAVNNTEFPNIAMTLNGLTSNEINFTSPRGLPENIAINGSGTITLTNTDGESVVITVYGTGRVDVCSDAIVGVDDCS